MEVNYIYIFNSSRLKTILFRKLCINRCHCRINYIANYVFQEKSKEVIMKLTEEDFKIKITNEYKGYRCRIHPRLDVDLFCSKEEADCYVYSKRYNNVKFVAKRKFENIPGKAITEVLNDLNNYLKEEEEYFLNNPKEKTFKKIKSCYIF